MRTLKSRLLAEAGRFAVTLAVCLVLSLAFALAMRWACARAARPVMVVPPRYVHPIYTVLLPRHEGGEDPCRK